MEPHTPDQEPLGTDPKGSELYRTAWIFYLVLAVIAVVWIGVREQGFGTEILWQQGLSRFELVRSLGFDLGLGLASAVFIVGLWEFCERTSAAAAEVAGQLRSMLGGLSVGEAIGLALLSGVGEELFFRGAVQGSFEGLGGWIFATALFAVLHGGPGKHFRWWTLFAAVAGGIMGLWLLLRGNLTAPLTTHVAVNGFQLVRAARDNRKATQNTPSH